MTSVFDDLHTLDPVSYIQGIGLQPEDCYGFLPINHEDITPYFFLYRDRPEYEQARAGLQPATPANQQLGPIRMPAAQQAELDMDRDLIGGSEGRAAGKIAEAMKMAEAFGAQPLSEWDPSAVGIPDPERLERLAKLRSSGAINDQEYARLIAEATAPPPSTGPPVTDIPEPPDPAAAPEPSPGTPGREAEEVPVGGVPVGGTIAAHRIYPGFRVRSSTRQLDHFLPRYREALGLCSEDVYGVIPRTTRLMDSPGQGSDTLEWDDFWIIYRDRPEYEQGRAAWAKEMNKDGKWPGAAFSTGAGEGSAVPFDGAKVKVEKDVWPREKLVMRQRDSKLGDSLRKKIGKWGYEPEDSLGFCPSFPNESIYFAWRKR